MDEPRGQFTFYASFFESARRIKNKSARADFYDAICEYALKEISPDLDKLSDAAAVGFISAQPNLDASRRKAKNGKAGGSVKQTGSKPEANDKQTPSTPPSPPKQTPREKEREKEKEKELEIEGELDIRSTPKAPPSPSASPIPAAPPPTPVEGKAFTAFWNAYPYKVSREDAWLAWCALNPQGTTVDSIMSALDDWKSSERWQEKGGKFIPKAAKWLSEGYWQSPPPRAEQKNAKRQLDADEQAAIRRMLQEGGTPDA